MNVGMYATQANRYEVVPMALYMYKVHVPGTRINEPTRTEETRSFRGCQNCP